MTKQKLLMALILSAAIVFPAQVDNKKVLTLKKPKILHSKNSTFTNPIGRFVESYLQKNGLVLSPFYIAPDGKGKPIMELFA